jgi:hypothetical protein
MKKERIYLISESGAAVASDEDGAQALEAVGYVRCTKEEYHKRMKKIGREDRAVADAMQWLERQEGK